MTLPDVFDAARPSIVALISRMVPRRLGEKPLFRVIVGTGFVVDPRGIVATNRHVADALQQLPPHPVTGAMSAAALVFSQVQSSGKDFVLGAAIVEIKHYQILDRFSSTKEWFGEAAPDVAFLQLAGQDLPALSLATEPTTLRIGRAIATAGFPLGEDALVLYGKPHQATPLLRHGIISSLYPFSVPSPHG